MLKTFDNPIAGINNYWSNSGILANRGFELTLTGKPIVRRHLNMELGVSLAHAQNKIKSMPVNTYYYIDEKAYLLYAGNDYGRKPHVVCKFTDLVEVTYLPHTKEVKLTKPGGTDYLKLAEGKDFVDEITEIFERIYPQDGHHTEGAEEASDSPKKD